VRCPEHGGYTVNPNTGIEHIALLHWGDLIEDFVSEIGVTLEDFREKMTGGWMFGYIRALQSAGIKTTLVCISARVGRVESWKHAPTGAAICVIPASWPYRWLLRLGIDSAVWKNTREQTRNRIAWHARRLLQDLLPYLATPVGLLRREIRQRQCQAILCQEYEHARFDLSVLAGALSGVPVFATFQGGDTRFSRLERLFRRTAIRKSAGLIIGSSRERKRVLRCYGAANRKVATIFNPLDLSMWYPENRNIARMTLRLPEHAFLVVWHGRIDLWRKGLDILIDGWRRLMRDRPDMDGYLVLVGDGSDSAALQRLIEAEEVVRILWRQEYVLDRGVMRTYLSAGDVYAFTSRHEGFPVAPLEAMACGLPVAAADCTGVRDIFAGDCDGGLVVPLDDSTGLAQALASLLDDEELRQRMSQAARKRVENSFSLDAVGNRLKEFFAVPDEDIPGTQNGGGNQRSLDG
jgi:glycosyltransferase involved in cell wall biosynthesis